MTTLAEQPIVNPNVTPNMEVFPVNAPSAAAQQPNFSDPAVVAAVQRARQEEKQKLYGTINKNKDTMREQSQRLEAQQSEINDLRTQIASLSKGELKGDAAVQAALESLKAELQATTRRNEELNRQIRQSQLDSYRERRLREIGTEIFVEMVGGQTEAEIDYSIERAAEAYQAQKQHFYNQFSRGYPQPMPMQMPVTAYPVPAQVPVGFTPPAYYPPNMATPAPNIAAPNVTPAPSTPDQYQAPMMPMNTYPVAPQSVGTPNTAPNPVVRGYYHNAMMGGQANPNLSVVPAQPSGFPSIPNGVTPAMPATSQQDLKNLTSEDAVRSGAYAQNRDKVLASVRSNVRR